MLFLISLLFVLLSVAFGSSPRPCYQHCRFHFCDGRIAFSLKSTEPDKPFTGAICDAKGYHVGTVTESGEPIVKTNLKNNYPYFQPISKWAPPGLQHRFSRTFFKALSVQGHYYYQGNKKIYYTDADRRKSFTLPNGKLSDEYYYYEKSNPGYYSKNHYAAISRESFQDNQMRIIRNRCIVLPLKKWQVVDNYGDVKYNLEAGKSDRLRDCVAFYAS